jgi:hypothetical protein
VNLANIHLRDAVGLETLRLGLRSDTMHLSEKNLETGSHTIDLSSREPAGVIK